MKRTMTLYELVCPDELKRINRMLNPYGIHIETDLFGNPYVLIDKNLLHQFHKEKTIGKEKAHA